MKGTALIALIKRHGGIASIHTVPVRDNHTSVTRWANMVVCADGWRRRLTVQEENALDKAEPGSLSVAANRKCEAGLEPEREAA